MHMQPNQDGPQTDYTDELSYICLILTNIKQNSRPCSISNDQSLYWLIDIIW